jgi:hypothetical protein
MITTHPLICAVYKAFKLSLERRLTESSIFYVLVLRSRSSISPLEAADSDLKPDDQDCHHSLVGHRDLYRWAGCRQPRFTVGQWLCYYTLAHKTRDVREGCANHARRGLVASHTRFSISNGLFNLAARFLIQFTPRKSLNHFFNKDELSTKSP